MSSPLLSVENISKTYLPRRGLFERRSTVRPALANASFTLGRGEILGVVGESGSGKTTLARCVALLERPDSGRVVLKGEDLTKLSPAQLRKARRRVQTVFQDPYASLNPRLTVGSALAEVMLVNRLASKGDVGARVAELLGHVGLPARAAQAYPAAFSGGQRQRICIARALAAEPEILIADEPVSSLDVSIQAQVINLLLDLKERLGLSVIFIGHDLELIDFIAPRILVMLSGEIVETIPEGGSIRDAQHPYTHKLLAAIPSLERIITPSTAQTRSE
jgi:peptide/nickel transport system ATP-binding protein